MFETLSHALFGNTGIANNIHNGTITSAMAQQYGNAIMQKEQVPKSKKLFHGTVEVLQVANGYIVNIGRKEGYEYETYIAETITDVNERIAAAIVAFQLESK
jgi:hypothetical protein